jgi:hypothetical protein
LQLIPSIGSRDNRRLDTRPNSNPTRMMATGTAALSHLTRCEYSGNNALGKYSLLFWHPENVATTVN